MLILPQTFQTAGFIPTTLTLIFVAILSAFCCLHMANTISKVPGNSNYEKEIDYSEAFKRFWGQKSFLATQVLFFFCVTCLNISSIVDTSQVVDTIFGHLLQGGSAALHLSWDNNNHNITNVGIVRWTYSQCSARALRHDKCIPFNHIHKGLYITLGYFISSLIFIPMALMDLKVRFFFRPSLLAMITLYITYSSSLAFYFETLLSSFYWLHYLGKCQCPNCWIRRLIIEFCIIYDFIFIGWDTHRVYKYVG